MSFYINNTNPNRPMPICGNVTNGIIEKVLIETNKVFDACVSQSTETGIVLNVTNYNPANPAFPLTFVSAQTTVGEQSIITDLVIDRLESCPNYANVSFNIILPITVTYRDANGIIGTATSNVTINKNVLLFVPQPAVAPVNITATGIFDSQIGSYTSDGVFTVTGCIQIVVKVVAPVDVLLPSYGYPVLPPCQTAPNQSACPGFSELPLYPTAIGPSTPQRF